jgi:hypothetical protein
LPKNCWQQWLQDPATIPRTVDYDKKNTIVECNHDTTALDIMVMAMIKFQKDVDEEVKDASDKDCIKLATFSSKKMK